MELTRDLNFYATEIYDRFEENTKLTTTFTAVFTISWWKQPQVKTRNH